MAMTDITKAQLIVEIRELINEPSAVLFSDTDIGAEIDFAANEMSKAMLFGETCTEQQLATTTQSYAYTTNLPRPEAIIYYGSSNTVPGTTARTLIKTHGKQMRHNAIRANGVPFEWWFADEKIWVYPIPAAGQNSHYLLILAHNYQSYDESVVPDYLQEYTVWYALAKCMEKKKNYAAAQQYMGIFDSFMMFHRLDTVLPKEVDSKDMMKTQDRTIVQEGR